MMRGRRAVFVHFLVMFGACMCAGYLLASVCHVHRASSLDSPSVDARQAPAVSSSAAAASALLDEADTFEPIIRSPPNFTLTGKKPSRPRFYSTELGTRRQLYVAVLIPESSQSADDPVVDLVLGINQTLSHITDDIGFYTLSHEHSHNADDAAVHSQLHSLPGFTVLNDQNGVGLALQTSEHLSRVHGSMYDYFFVVSASTYVNGQRLVDLVSSLSVSVNTFSSGSQPDTANSPHRCTIESGVLMSHQVLNSVSGRLGECVLHDEAAVTADRDSVYAADSLVQCVHKLSGQQCSHSAQGTQLVSYDASQLTDAGDEAGYQDNESSVVGRLLTVRHVTDSRHFRRLHVRTARHQLSQLSRRIEHLRASLSSNQQKLRALLAKSDAAAAAPVVRKLADEPLQWPLGSAPAVRTSSRHHINLWQRFTRSHVYLATPDSVATALTSSQRIDIEEVLDLGIGEASRVAGVQYSLVQLRSGHMRFDGGRGMDYVLDLEVTSDPHTDTVEVKRVEVHKPILKAELIPMPFVTEKPTVTVVLPVLPSQVQRAQEFVDTVVANNENVALVFVLVSDNRQSAPVFRPLVHTIQTFNNGSTGGARMAWITVLGEQDPDNQHVTPSQFFIMDVVSRKISPRALVLLLHSPALEYISEMFNRVRMQTIVGWEVFCPVPWVEYHPDLVYTDGVRAANLKIHKDHGRFDGDFYGIVSFYMQDYYALRNKTTADIGWMSSADLSLDRQAAAQYPYDLFGALVRHSHLHVHRATDPSFRLYYFTRSCPSVVRAFHERACVNSLLEGVGSQSQLARALIEYRKQQQQQQEDANITA